MLQEAASDNDDEDFGALNLVQAESMRELVLLLLLLVLWYNMMMMMMMMMTRPLLSMMRMMMMRGFSWTMSSWPQQRSLFFCHLINVLFLYLDRSFYYSRKNQNTPSTSKHNNNNNKLTTTRTNQHIQP
jgi:hypothetical protein